MVTTFSHFGICVTDLERSVAFYCEGLGFERAERHEIGAEFARLMELDDVAVSSQFIRRDQSAIELLCFSTPTATIEPRRPLPTAGLTHLSFRVDDVDETAARLVALGGTIVENTSTDLTFGDIVLHFVYLVDPDGTRVELMDLGQ